MSKVIFPSLIALLLLAGCQPPRGSAVIQPTRYTIGPGIDTTSSLDQVELMATTIAPYRDQLSEEMNRVVAELGSPLVKGKPESTLGNWVTDLIAEAAADLFPDLEIAFAVHNYGGIRISELGAGPLIVSELFELMPFDNELVVVGLTGFELIQFVEFMAEDGGWPVSGNLIVEVVGDVMSVAVGRESVIPTQTYYVALPDYVAGGGDGAGFFLGKPIFSSNRMIRDLLIDYAGRSAQPIEVRDEQARRFSINRP